MFWVIDESGALTNKYSRISFQDEKSVHLQSILLSVQFYRSCVCVCVLDAENKVNSRLSQVSRLLRDKRLEHPNGNGAISVSLWPIHRAKIHRWIFVSILHWIIL